MKPRPDESALGFGRYFSDHLFISDYKDGAWDGGRIIPYGPLAMDPASSVLHYGQALFEGLKAFPQKNGGIKVFRPKFNSKRMNFGAERLCLPEVPEELFVEGAKALLRIDADWMPKAAGTSIYLRPTLIGTEGFLGVRPSQEAKFFVIASPVGRYYKGDVASVKIWIETKDLRAAPGGLGATKAGANYAASLRAAWKAKDKGCAQVLWTDHTHQYVEEVGTMNVFFVMGKQVITPALNGSILEGGTRNCCIQLLRDQGFEVIERQITIAEIKAAAAKGEMQEAFGTGTAAVITPVESFSAEDGTWELGRGFGPVSKALFDEITAIQYGEKPDRYNWLEDIG